MAFFLPPLARGQIRRAPLDLASKGQRRATDLGERPSALDAHVDVNAARARRLRPPDQPQIGQRRADDAGDGSNLIPVNSGHRVEIDAQLVGVIEIVGAHRMWMELEAGQVGHPDQGRGVARHDFLRGPAGWELQRHDLDPPGSRFRCSLLVEEFPIDTVRIPYEYVRPIAGRAKCTFGDGDVVPGDVELGIAGLREKRLARVGDRDFPTSNRQHFMFDPARHPSIVAWDRDTAPNLLGGGHCCTRPVWLLPGPAYCSTGKRPDVRHRKRT